MAKPIYKSYDELPIVLSAKDLSAAMCISRSGAYALMAQNDFPTVTVGNRKLIPKAAFIKWLEGAAEF